MELKQRAAERALDSVTSGMALGLGTGSTVSFFLQGLARKMAAGKLERIVGVPTSRRTARQADQLGIPLGSLADHPSLDLAVDGADEVDPDLNLIKGLGRALTREKIVEIHAERFLVIVDDSKLVDRLGRGPLPVELVPFQVEAHLRWLESLGGRVEHWLEEDGAPATTDGGNQLARLHFEDGIEDPDGLADELDRRPGIVEHGLFLRMASEVLVAGDDGVRIL